jgi:hypothetical protein
MKKEVVEIRINTTGGFTFKAKEGFSGESCIERTKDLELALGGKMVSQEKTKDYYRPDDADPLTIKLN